MSNIANIQEVEDLRQNLNKAVDALVELTVLSQNGAQTQQNEQAGFEVFKTKAAIESASRALIAKIANPALKVHTLGPAPLENLVVRIGIELDIYNILAKAGPTGYTLNEVVKLTGADRTFLLRILRSLSTYGYLSESNDDAVNRYTLSPSGQAMLQPAIRDWIKVFFDDILVAMTHFPKFLANRSHKTSGGADDNLYKDLYGMSYFPYTHSDADRLATFNSAMKIQDLIPKFVLGSFPFNEYYSELRDAVNKDASTVAIVDVGGGRGGALESIRHDFPDLPGRIILQDLPQVISDVNETDTPSRLNIETMVQDFMTPNVIKGAKFYHIRRCVHNHPEEACVKMLNHLHDAMKGTPEFSRLLLHENILPTKNVAVREVAIDLTMMLTLCGMERDEEQWEDLLRRTGFEIVRIVRAKLGDVGVIEAKVITN